MARRLSIRTGTTLMAASIAGLALVIGAVTLVLTLDTSLTRSGDRLAISRARDLASLAESGTLPAVLSNITGESVAQVVDSSGRVVAASPNVTGRSAITAFRGSPGEPVLTTVEGAPDDDETETYRIWALRAESADGPVTIYVGDSLESVGEATRTVRRSLLIGLPVMLVALAGLTWLLIGRALRPVEDIRSEVARISATALDQRVRAPAANDEIGRLAATMNEMLDRIELASRRQREFVADASHELQSPLTALRAQLEVALAHPRGVDWPGVARAVLDDSVQMERLISDLLFLAREQDTEPPGRDVALDLDDIVLQETGRAGSRAEVRLDTSGVSAGPVRGSVDDLRRLVRNLIENAVQYAATTVAVSVSTDGTWTRLDVCDDGPGVAREEFEKVFERFYRADRSRDRRDGAGGTGLGLAIARSIVQRHGGSVSMVESGLGAHVVVVLPASDGLQKPPAGSDDARPAHFDRTGSPY